ncbi:MAG TPA: hypothetical protein P5136_02805, partial [Methanofastidiosum sp.]|nr:hypothetical protein [Methanofastidiosum sp.]
ELTDIVSSKIIIPEANIGIHEITVDDIAAYTGPGISGSFDSSHRYACGKFGFINVSTGNGVSSGSGWTYGSTYITMTNAVYTSTYFYTRPSDQLWLMAYITLASTAATLRIQYETTPGSGTLDGDVSVNIPAFGSVGKAGELPILLLPSESLGLGITKVKISITSGTSVTFSKLISGVLNTNVETAEHITSIEASLAAALVPIGVILPYLPGYFANSSNSTFTDLYSGGSLSDSYRLCDGTAVNDPASPIFNGTGRYLPNLTDNRFLMGGVISPTLTGGTNSSTHTHSLPGHYHQMNTGIGSNLSATTSTHSNTHSHTISTFHETITGSTHAINYSNQDGSDPWPTTTGSYSHSHSHTISSSQISGSIGNVTGGIDGNTTMTTTAISATENRPLYLTCRFIMRIK